MPQVIRWKKNVTTLLPIWRSAMIILVWPHRVRHSPARYEGGASDVSLTSTWRRQSFPPLPLSFDYKIVAHLILGAEPPLLPACYLSQASYINKSTSCLSLCLSLNSFCTETQRTWASVSLDTSWVILIKRPWVQVPIRVLAGLESQHVGSSSNLRYTVSIRVSSFISIL